MSDVERLAQIMTDADCASREFPFTDESRAAAILASDWWRSILFEHESLVSQNRELVAELARQGREIVRLTTVLTTVTSPVRGND